MPEALKPQYAASVPDQAPSDLPMRPYSFQRDDLEIDLATERNGTMELATEILRKANLLGSSAASQGTK